jgi:3-oxoadipate enol-lactonase
MPVIDANGVSIHVEIEGPERAPFLILSNSLGTTLHMWDGQVGPFTQHFRLIRFDCRTRRAMSRTRMPGTTA